MKIKHSVRTSSHNEGEFPTFIKKTVKPYIIITEEFNSAEEFLAIYKPINLSENLKLAIDNFFNKKRRTVTFNYGTGNKTFYVV